MFNSIVNRITRYAAGLSLLVTAQTIQATDFNSNWIVNAQQLSQLLSHGAKVVYVVKQPGDKPSDIIQGTDHRRTIPWAPNDGGTDSFAIRVYSETLAYPNNKKFPKAKPTINQWSASMQRLGINNGDHVVLVGHREFSARFAKTMVEYGGKAVVYNENSSDNLLTPLELSDTLDGAIEKGNFVATLNATNQLSMSSQSGDGVDSNLKFWDIRASSYPKGEKTKSYVYASGTLNRASNDLRFTHLLNGSGSWYLPADQVSEILTAHFGDPSKQGNTKHVIVCDSEGLSNIVMWGARALGYNNVFVLEGGLHEFTMDTKNHNFVSVLN